MKLLPWKFYLTKLVGWEVQILLAISSFFNSIARHQNEVMKQLLKRIEDE